MNKKILTIENLIEFCEKQNFHNFNAKESGYQLCIQVPASFEKDETTDNSMLFGNIKLLHSGRNKNKSNVTEKAAEKCMSTIAYKPILANFTDVNGELDFTSHDFEINDDGSVTYYEKQVGCFTADKPYMQQDPDHEERKYVYAKCAIPRNYTAAADIIERKEGTKISAELGINKMSYDSKEKELLLEDIVVLGATLLGVDPESGNEIQEGMENARLDIADFSIDNNSVFSKSELVKEITQAIMNKLDDHIAEFTANNNQGKEECEMDKLDNEVIAIEEETPEMVKKFDGEESGSEQTGEQPGEQTQPIVSEPTDAEVADGVSTAISALTDNSSEADVDAARSAYDSLTDDQKALVDSDVVAALEAQENRIAEAKEAAMEEHVAISNIGTSKKKNDFSIDYTVNLNGEVRNFSVSLIEKLSTLYELVNATYGESDNTWYDVDAYDDEKVVIMHDYWNNKHYKQSYSVKKDTYSLKGDRVEVFCTYLTRDEQTQLDSMKSNYSSISQKLEKYESEPAKMDVLNSDDYSCIADQVEFSELKKQENHFDLSVDEVKEKADSMLLQYAKSGKLNFAAIEQKKEEPKKDFFAFARVEQNNSFLDGLLKNRK